MHWVRASASGTAILVAVCLTAEPAAQRTRYDVVIANGRIVDGTGLVVAPGFIDMLGQSEFNVLVDGRAASKVLQGVTTEVTGEGTSIAPVNDRMMTAARASAEHFGVTQNWRT